LALYTGQCNYRIKPAIGAVRLSALKPHDVQSFINKQTEHTNNKPALSPKSIKNLHGILHKALQQAVDIGYLKTNPADAVKLPRNEKKEITPLDSNQIALFLKAIKGHRFELLFTVALFTGLRQSELIGMTWDCIQGDTIYIYRQLQRIEGSVYRFMTLKNDKTRRIAPAMIIIRKLKEHNRKQKEQRLLAGEAWRNEDNFIFTDELGNHLAQKTVHSNFKRIVKGIGLPNTRFHDLCHSCASLLLANGVSLKEIQDWLGHSTFKTTADIYAHLDADSKRATAAAMSWIKNTTLAQGMAQSN
jgi:integrase